MSKTYLEDAEEAVLEVVRVIVAERDRALFLLNSARELSEARRQEIEKLKKELERARS